MSAARKDHKVLFTPGPTEVAPEILREMARPVIGHRGAEMQEVIRDLVPRLRLLFGTRAGDIFLTACSATGLWEAALRNCVARRALVPVCGAFSERFYEVALACGLEADPLHVEWGKAVPPQAVADMLATGRYDAVALVHNETATGVTNPLSEIAEVVRRQGDVALLVDAVSSLGGIPVECVVRFGDPAKEILRDAEAFGADLIALSTKTSSSLSRAVLGSVAEQVFRKAAPAVVLYRTAREGAG